MRSAPKRTYFWGLAGLLLSLAWPSRADILVLPASPPAATKPAPVIPSAQRQCFQLQFLLRLPGLEALHFIGAVKALRDVDAGDRQDTGQRVADLSTQAVDLRRDEAHSFTQLSRLLKAMGATPSLQSWVASETDRLSKPLVYTNDEQKDAKTEPAVAAVLATLDEADALKVATDNHLSALAVWLSLTRGPAGLWAGNVGEATAALHVALLNNEEPRLAAAVTHRLRSAAPTGTPAAVLDALGLLVPKGGNLSGLVPIAANISRPSLTQAHDALLAAFDAKGIAADSDKPVALENGAHAAGQ